MSVMEEGTGFLNRGPIIWWAALESLSKRRALMALVIYDALVFGALLRNLSDKGCHR